MRSGLVGLADSAPGLGVVAGQPEKQCAHRISPVHGVKQVTNLGVFPNKRTLDFRQGQNAGVNIGDKRLQRVGYLGKKRHGRSYIVGRYMNIRSTVPSVSVLLSSQAGFQPLQRHVFLNSVIAHLAIDH